MGKQWTLVQAVGAITDPALPLDDLRSLKRKIDAEIEKREKEREVEVRAGWSTDGRLIFKIVPVAIAAPNTTMFAQLSSLLNTVEGLEVRYWHSEDQSTPATLRIPLSLADTLADALHKAALRK